MKKIAFLSYYCGIVDRGVETFVSEIGRRLARDFQVDVYCAGNFAQSKYKVRKIKCPKTAPKESTGLVAKLYLDRQSLHILLFTILLIPRLVKNKYDVIIPTNGGWQVALVKILSFLTRSKIIITGHAGIGGDDAWSLLWHPNIFIALTTPQANWARRLTTDVKIAIIPNGVDLHRFKPNIEAARISLQKPIAICASALVPYKRLDLTIKAVAKAGNLSLLVIGDGQLKGAVDGLGKRLLGSRYLRLVVPHQKIPAYYRAAKLFTLASQTEAFGISYVEAMACNLPVVTTKDKSRAEVVGDAGVLVNTKNINRYAKSLAYVARTNFKNKPYTQALKFSWNKIAQKYMSVITDLTA